MVQVVAALIWREERFLICQRPADKARGLLWEFVGGKVEPGETPEEALMREVREELGIETFTPEVVDKYVFESQRERELVYVHRTTYDGEIHPSTDELDGGRFWTMSEVRDAMGKGVLTPNFENEFSRCFGDMSVFCPCHFTL